MSWILQDPEGLFFGRNGDQCARIKYAEKYLNPLDLHHKDGSEYVDCYDLAKDLEEESEELRECVKKLAETIKLNMMLINELRNHKH